MVFSAPIFSERKSTSENIPSEHNFLYDLREKIHETDIFYANIFLQYQNDICKCSMWVLTQAHNTDLNCLVLCCVSRFVKPAYTRRTTG